MGVGAGQGSSLMVYQQSLWAVRSWQTAPMLLSPHTVMTTLGLKRDDGLIELGHQFCWSKIKIKLYSNLTTVCKPAGRALAGGHRDGTVR